jgi:hypothetical protein
VVHITTRVPTKHIQRRKGKTKRATPMQCTVGSQNVEKMATFHNGMLCISRMFDLGMMINVQTGWMLQYDLMHATCSLSVLLQDGKGWTNFLMMFLKVLA